MKEEILTGSAARAGSPSAAGSGFLDQDRRGFNSGFCFYPAAAGDPARAADPVFPLKSLFLLIIALLLPAFVLAGEKEDKAKRDVELLSQALKQEPGNPRFLFDLAQAHKTLKQHDEAIKGLRSRLEKEGNHDEIWLCKYLLGECYEDKNEWDHALYWYLEAFQHDTSRPHPLRKIATYYRCHGENDLAYIFAKHGSRIPFPGNLNLTDSSIFDYQFDEELSIAAYYTRFKEEGFAASNNIMLKKNVPWYIKDQAYRNAAYYVQTIRNARVQPILLDLPLIQAGSEERYHPMNPAIIKTEQGYAVICRAVNYTQTGAKIFNTIDWNGIYRSKNYLVRYDRNFKLLSQQEIIENLPRERIRTCIVEGLEDCRLFEFGKSLWFTCTTSDTNPTGQRQISLCKLRDGETGSTAHIDQLVPLKGPDLNRCEKNWLPFVKEGTFQTIYWFDPFIVFRPDMETGDAPTTIRYETTHDFSRFRGSAGPIEFGAGYLVLVHEVIHLPDSSRYYLHRFVYLDKNFMVQKLSKPFIFQHLGVEFCCSMTLDHSKTDLIMTIGIEDREAYFYFLDLETIQTLLEPLPKLQ